MDSVGLWILVAVVIVIAAAAMAIAMRAFVGRDASDSSSTMTGEQWFTLGIVLTGAGVALTTTVGPTMLAMVALGLIYMGIGASKKRKEGETP
jgi:hypothetical protein